MNWRSTYKARNKWAIVLVAIMLLDIILPTTLSALTTGPSQPEVQSFEPMGTTDMVDIFSGDFTYNIPLFELPGPNGGYPFNLAYHAGITMEQEASWVGLGWNLNVGSINRQMRGVPDDFKGDEITNIADMKSNKTIGVTIGAGGFEIFGLDFLKGQATITPYHNSYRGFGYSIGFTPTFTFGNDRITASVGATLQSDSQNGTSYSPSVSLSAKMSDDDAVQRGIGVNFSLSYNSRSGATSFGYGVTASASATGKDPKIKNEKRKEKVNNRVKKHLMSKDEEGNDVLGERSVGAGASLSLQSINSYVPSVPNKMTGKSINILLNLGTGNSGAFNKYSLGGFYDENELKYKNDPIKSQAYGSYYMHEMPNLSSTNGFEYIMDFNREGDGAIQKNTPVLPIPILTDDIYSVSGQGVGGIFRCNRSSVGYLRDFTLGSKTFGGSLGLDFGPGYGGHVGGIGTFSRSENHNFLWDLSELDERYSYGNKDSDPYFEPTYFRFHQELAMEDPYDVNSFLKGMDGPSNFNVVNKSRHFHWEKLITKGSSVQYNNRNVHRERRARANIAQPIPNKYIKSDDQVFTELDIQYYDGIDKIEIPSNNASKENYYPQQYLNRGAIHKDHHIGGFTTLDQSGARYVYGLPAYNKKHEEHSFSTPRKRIAFCENRVQDQDGINGNTYSHYTGDEHRNVKKLPPYVHSYLLSAVLGADYVDIDNNGPSEKDLGYWVKFNYVKADDYAWRTPYKGANYIPGHISDGDDDKGFFMHGERENWYLASAETKTHIAKFSLSAREDAKGSLVGGGGVSYQIDKIDLFTKEEIKLDPQNPRPIKTVHFKYANDPSVNEPELCQGVDNNFSGGGKLTLSRVYFTYRNSTRGSLNQYKFDYHQNNVEENPPYRSSTLDETDRTDCWGYYNSSIVECAPSKPYVPQPNTENEIKNKVQSQNDIDVAAWSLKEITTPSGAIIEVDYEADDYAYVQDKKAMQMFHISKNQGGADGRFYFNNGQDSYVIADLDNYTYTNDNVGQLLEGTDQLYFKALVNLIGPDAGQYAEYVAGYLKINKSKGKNGVELIDNGTRAKIYVKPFKQKGSDLFHPISHAALDFLQANRQALLSEMERVAGSTAVDLDGDLEKAEARDNMKQMFGTILQMFKFRHNYYATAHRKEAASAFHSEYSFVRLNNIAGFKEGGGLRVKQVKLKESVNGAEYGQVYNYTTVDEESGNLISSGVATFEPNAGGEQNPLIEGIKYNEQISVKTNLRLFMETPYNRSYYPGPSVGYSKVTVKSLATHLAENKEPGYTIPKTRKVNGVDEPYDYAIPTTGTNVHEFYTCKDFPVYNDKTAVSITETHDKKHIFLVGEKHDDYLGASQGFFIELNDMHGKVKSMAYHAQDIEGNMVYPAYSSIQYNYKLDKQNSKRLNSNVTALLPDGSQKEMLLGLDYDFYMDARASYVSSKSNGQNFNTDIVMLAVFPLVLLNWLPTIGHEEKTIHTVTTNKVIWRTGIIDNIVAKDENSIITTKNLLYDPVTGAPLLTEVQNNFDDPVYSLNIPAYWKYEGMGPAYKNLDLKFKANIASVQNTNLHKLDGHNAKQWLRNLYPGDELVLTLDDGSYKKAYLMQMDLDNVKIGFDGKEDITQDDVEVYVVRSGRRNQLSVNAGTVTALKDPLDHVKFYCPQPQ